MKTGFSIHIQNNIVRIANQLADGYDSFVLQNENLEIAIEGMILNKRELLKQYAVSSFQNWVLEIYAQKKENCINLLEGEFRGYIWDKKLNKIFVFTNPTATQRIFYTKIENQIWIDSHLINLHQQLMFQGIKPSPNIEAMYQLLCFTNMPETQTPLLGVSKLLDGHYLAIDIETLSYIEIPYFECQKFPVFSGSKEKAIDDVHEIFSESIRLEYEKDKELNSDHLCLLSGGLDSRVAMLYSIQNNFTPNQTLCFSQSGYYDEKISKNIAEDYHLPYQFIPLDGGQFLSKIDQLTYISEGMVLYTGGIHVQHAMDHLEYSNFKIFHGGQIGDGVLGGFNTASKEKKPSYFKLVVNRDFLPKVKTSLDKILSQYETEEQFLLRNIAFNRTILGGHVLQQLAYQTSPFMTKDFLKFSLSLPAAWKHQHYFYLEWIAKHCPEATQYIWERTLMKPNATWKTFFGDQLVKRTHRIFYEKILGKPEKVSMYPYAYYYENSKLLKDTYEQYFSENLSRLDSYPELRKDVINLYQSSEFFHKTQAVNILAIFKLFF